DAGVPPESSPSPLAEPGELPPPPGCPQPDAGAIRAECAPGPLPPFAGAPESRGRGAQCRRWFKTAGTELGGGGCSARAAPLAPRRRARERAPAHPPPPGRAARPDRDAEPAAAGPVLVALAAQLQPGLPLLAGGRLAESGRAAAERAASQLGGPAARVPCP